MGKWLILAGAILIIVGVIVEYMPWLLNWFGKLPGDIRIENEKTKIYIPIVSMIVLSLFLTLLLNLFRR
jgi:H+/Cl- antiporter ClcA